jgi:hypothetical protein
MSSPSSTVTLVVQDRHDGGGDDVFVGTISEVSLAALFPVYASCVADDAEASTGEACRFDFDTVDGSDAAGVGRFIVRWCEAVAPSVVVTGTAVGGAAVAVMAPPARAPASCLGLSRPALIRAALAPFAPCSEAAARVFLEELRLVPPSSSDGGDGSTAGGSSQACRDESSSSHAIDERALILSVARIHSAAVAGGCPLLQAQCASVLAALVREAAIVGRGATRAWQAASAAEGAGPADPRSARETEATATWVGECLRGVTTTS